MSFSKGLILWAGCTILVAFLHLFGLIAQPQPSSASIPSSASNCTTAVLSECITEIQAETIGSDVVWTINCINPCTGGCSEVEENGPFGTDAWCACTLGGDPPECCHAALRTGPGGNQRPVTRPAIQPCGGTVCNAGSCVMHYGQDFPYEFWHANCQ